MIPSKFRDGVQLGCEKSENWYKVFLHFYIFIYL